MLSCWSTLQLNKAKTRLALTLRWFIWTLLAIVWGKKNLAEANRMTVVPLTNVIHTTVVPITSLIHMSVVRIAAVIRTMKKIYNLV